MVDYGLATLRLWGVSRGASGLKLFDKLAQIADRLKMSALVSYTDTGFVATETYINTNKHKIHSDKLRQTNNTNSEKHIAN